MEELTAHEVTVPAGFGVAAQQRGQRSALHPRRRRRPGLGQQRRCDVGQLHQRIAHQPIAVTSRPRHDERHAHQRLVEATALVQQAVLPHHVAVVGGEDDDRVLSLTTALEAVEHATHVVVDQGDHGEIRCLHLPASIQVEGHRRQTEIDVGETRLVGGVRLADGVPRQLVCLVPLEVFPRGIQRRVRIEGIDAHQPRGLTPLLLHELDGAIRAPRRLMHVGWHVEGTLVEVLQTVSLLVHPVRVVVTFGPLVARVVAPVKDPVAVVAARFDPAMGAGQMQLARQPAVVTGIG